MQSVGERFALQMLELLFLPGFAALQAWRDAHRALPEVLLRMMFYNADLRIICIIIFRQQEVSVTGKFKE